MIERDDINHTCTTNCDVIDDAEESFNIDANINISALVNQ